MKNRFIRILILVALYFGAAVKANHDEVDPACVQCSTKECNRGTDCERTDCFDICENRNISCQLDFRKGGKQFENDCLAKCGKTCVDVACKLGQSCNMRECNNTCPDQPKYSCDVEIVRIDQSIVHTECVRGKNGGLKGRQDTCKHVCKAVSCGKDCQQNYCTHECPGEEIYLDCVKQYTDHQTGHYVESDCDVLSDCKIKPRLCELKPCDHPGA